MSKKFYAYRVLSTGKRQRLTPMGRRTFGVTLLRWLKRRAKRKGWKLIVKRVRVVQSSEDMKRDKAVAAMHWALSREPSIHYSQRRPFKVNAVRDKHSSIYTDCSGIATMIHKAAGFRDPNNLGYSGYGYTGTVRAECPRKRLGSLKPGDTIVYGSGTGRHMVVVLSGGGTMNPTVFSHGQESGPRKYSHAVQVSVHGGTFTCHGPRL